jgi:co-chaperonin GroES (HSP10)
MEFTMVLEPRNKWIEVELSFDNNEQQQESIIALPDDYRPSEKPYKAVSVIRDPDEEYKNGDVIVTPTHVIQEIEIDKNKFYLVERNYIMATVRRENNAK